MMKKIVKGIILIVLIGVLSYTGYEMYQEAQIKEKANSSLGQVKQENITKTQVITQKEEAKKDLKLVKKEYKGYEVSAKLKIEKLNIDTYVLANYSKQAMEVCVAKYYGPEPNEVGNYCIAGHNYITKNMFSKLGTLEIGDEIILTDNYHGKITYEVYDKYKAKPEDTSPLLQNTNGQKEITLITCSDYSTKRIIIKAKERSNLL